jgi:hypothetical protein
MRLLVGAVLLAMTALLLAYRRGGWWTAVLALSSTGELDGTDGVPRAVDARTTSLFSEWSEHEPST